MNLEKVKTKQMNNNLKAGLITVALLTATILILYAIGYLVTRYEVLLYILCPILIGTWLLYIFLLIKEAITTDES